ncbi:MAG TPA: hypothetical protein VHA56_10420 [Mucilaginibacter sp.]|nr:hypothetical protein [Mucilaginibacter sp.]
MKTYNKTAPTKLIVKFDNELKNILANDLKSFLHRNPFLMRRLQEMAHNTLSVA